MDEKGVLLEPLFAVTRIQSIDGGGLGCNWTDSWMADSGWTDIEHAIEYIYEVAKGNMSTHPNDISWKEQYHDAHVSFIGLWSPEYSTGDWENGSQQELDGFVFEGEGKVVAISLDPPSQVS